MSERAACTPAWRRRVSAYHDGGLPSPERTLVEDHLRDCPDCQHLLRHYDGLYRNLRGMPGFEGLLTITKPGTRRGLGGSARPAFTWPGKNTSSTAGPGRAGARHAGGGPIIVTLLVLVALGFLVGRATNALGPQAQNTNAFPPPETPTLAALTSDGVACANAGQTTAYPYLYSDKTGHVISVASCGATHTIATLPTDVQFDALSPDNSQLLASAPALTARKAGERTRLYLLTLASGAWREVGLSTDGIQAPYSADEAEWQDATTIILRSGATVVTVDLTKQTVTPIAGITATHIAVRGTTLFYSTVQDGKATLHRRVQQPKLADDVVLSLGAGATCATPTCWRTLPWDVSADGKLVAYPTPVPALPLTTTPTLMKLVLQNVQNGTRATLGTVSLTTAPTAVSIAPDARYVAIIDEASGTANQLLLFSVAGRTVLSDVLAGWCVWRPDGSALVCMPFIASATDLPRLITVASGTASALAPLTTNYLWLH